MLEYLLKIANWNSSIFSSENDRKVKVLIFLLLFCYLLLISCKNPCLENNQALVKMLPKNQIVEFFIQRCVRRKSMGHFEFWHWDEHARTKENDSTSFG